MLSPGRAAACRILGIEPGDSRVLGWAGLACFLLNAGELLAWNTLLGRYLAELGPAWMPTMYIATNLLSAALFVAIARFGESAAAAAGIRTWALGAVACFVAVGIRPAKDEAVWVFVSFLVAWGYEIVFEPEFWGWTGRLLPLRLLKRVTPGIGSCGLAGRLAGAVLATDPFGLASVPAQTLLAAVLTLGALPALSAGERAAAAHPDCRAGSASGPAAAPAPSPSREGSAPAPPSPASGPSPRPAASQGLGDALAFVLGSPLLSRVLAGSLLMGFAMGSVDYPLSALAKQAYPDAAALSAFFGQLCLGIYLSAVIVQALGTGALLRRLPLSAAFGVMPGYVLLAGLLAAWRPTFTLAAASTLGLFVLVRAFHTPVTLVLLGPVPSRFADPARALAYGLGSALGFLVAGLGLEFLGGGSPELRHVYLALAAAGGLGLAFARGTDRAYLEGLRQRIEESDADPRLLDVERTGAGEALLALAETGDPELIRVVQDALAGGSGTTPETLAAGLAGLPPEAAARAFLALAVHGLRGEPATSLGLRLLADPDPGRGWTAAEASLRLCDPSLAPGLADLATTGASPVVRLRAAGALLWLGDRNTDLDRAVATLSAGLTDPDPGTRAAALRALSLRPSPGLRRRLVAGLADPDPAVVKAAARGLVRCRVPASLAELEAARSAATDPEAAAELDRALHQLQDETLARITRVLGSLDDRARHALSQSLASLPAGPSLALAAPALELEPATRREAALAALAGAEAGGWLEALHPLLVAPSGTPPGPVPLAARIRELGLPPESPAARLLVEIPPGAFAPDLARVGEAAVLALEHAADPEPAADTLGTAAFLVGYPLGMADALVGAVHSLADPDPRQASAAEELLEASGADRDLTRRLVAAARRPHLSRAPTGAPDP